MLILAMSCLFRLSHIYCGCVMLILSHSPFDCLFKTMSCLFWLYQAYLGYALLILDMSLILDHHAWSVSCLYWQNSAYILKLCLKWLSSAYIDQVILASTKHCFYRHGQIGRVILISLQSTELLLVQTDLCLKWLKSCLYIESSVLSAWSGIFWH